MPGELPKGHGKDGLKLHYGCEAGSWSAARQSHLGLGGSEKALFDPPLSVRIEGQGGVFCFGSRKPHSSDPPPLIAAFLNHHAASLVLYVMRHGIVIHNSRAKLAALRHFLAPMRGGQERGNPLNRERERNAYAPRMRTCTQPAQLSLLEHSLQPTPSPLCGLASWPLLGACSVFPGEQFLT